MASFTVRFLKAVTRTVELNVDVYLQKIQSEEAKVNNLARLLDADRKCMTLLLPQSLAHSTSSISKTKQVLIAGSPITCHYQPATPLTYIPIDSRQSAAYMEQKFSDQNTILDALNSGIQDLSLMYKSSISSRFVSMQQVLDWIGRRSLQAQVPLLLHLLSWGSLKMHLRREFAMISAIRRRSLY